MKKLNSLVNTPQLFIIIVALIIISSTFFKTTIKNHNDKLSNTSIVIKNMSDEDSVKVFVTLSAKDSVIGLFGITKKDTIGSKSKGFFYAKKNTIYYSNRNHPIKGGVISFGADNQSCQSAVKNGFKNGVNIFEFSINIPYETFDISCVDGVNCKIKVYVSDTLKWSTGYSSFKETFNSCSNNLKIEENCNIRGVFPYRCTDCTSAGAVPPKNCFKLKKQCNSKRTCQVARTKNNGGNIIVEYVGK